MTEAAAEPVRLVPVRVTFLRRDLPPGEPRPLPPGASVVTADRIEPSFYRYLYDTVGEDYGWWLRRAMPRDALAAILRHPDVTVRVLMAGGQPAGFYELDRRHRPATNLSYFGLLPHAVGHGLGTALLDDAITQGFAGNTRAMTVNTCTADHPRALPTYLRAGFLVTRAVDEAWRVPLRLGLGWPVHLASGPGVQVTAARL